MKKHLFFLLLPAFLFTNFSKPVVQKVRKGKDYALFFAVNTYQNPKITPLQNPINDAKKIAAQLQDNYDFETEIVENPTYEVIEQKVQYYTQQFNTGKFDSTGQLLIFFSGHGSKHLSNGYFLPANANPDDLKRSAFSYQLWQADINAIPCKHILVSIDACYSGSFDPKFGMKNDGLFGTRAGELSEGQLLITEHDKHRTRLFFTSGETDQPTPDKSDFAKKFIDAFVTKGYDDGILTSSEMFANHLEKANPRPRRGEFGSDEGGSSFVFISTKGGIIGNSATIPTSNLHPVVVSEETIYTLKQLDNKPVLKDRVKLLKDQTVENWIENNIKHDTFEVTVEVSFVVEKDGSTSQHKIINNNISPYCHNESLRLLSKLPKFGVPGMINKSNVRTLYLLKISFFNINRVFKVDELLRKPQPPFLYQQWIEQNLVYSELARKQSLQGTIRTQFIVEKDGSLTDIKITKDVGGGSKQEAIRLLTKMSKWNPGRINDQVVRVLYTDFHFEYMPKPSSR